MNPVPENELLSAYLDGELTADEQAQVEQLLATSPAARQLVDELRALRVGLQALPAHRIGADISQEVLRRAQLRVESEAAPPRPRTEQREESSQPESPFLRTLLGRAFRPRALVWSGLAVSVAVVLFVVESSRDRGPDDGSVAMRTSSAGAGSEDSSMEADSEAGDELADATPDLGEEMFEKEEGARGRRSYGFGRGEPSEPASEAVTGAPSATVSQAAKDADKSGVAEKPASLPLVGKGAREGGAGYRVRRGVGGVDTGGLPGGSGVGRQVAPSAGKKLESDDRHAGIARRAKGAEGGAGRDSMAKGAQDALLGPGADQAPALVVMQCNVTAKAVPVFGTLLDKQQITLAQARGFRGTGVMGKGHELEQRLNEALAESTNQITFDFEATPDQLLALMRDLKGRPAEFSSVSSVSYASSRGGVSLGLWDLAGTREAIGREDDKSPYAGAPLTTKPAMDTALKKNGRVGQEDPFGARMLPRRTEVRQQAEGEPPAAAVEDKRGKLLRTLEDAAESEVEGKPGLGDMSREPKEQPSQEQTPEQFRPPMPAAPQAGLAEPAKAGEKARGASEKGYPEETPSDEKADADVQEGARQRMRQARRVERTPARPGPREHAELPVPTERVGQPALPHQFGKRGQVVAKYRVRFVLHILSPEASTAAAVAQEAAGGDLPAEKAARMADVNEGAPADEAKPATVDP